MRQFLQTVWNFGLRDILDIFLVSYLFYRVMLLVRGTRSVQVIQGILLLAFATFLADGVFHLTVTAWILQKFWVAGVVIVAVVFQPEIRAALAQLGGHSTFHWVLTGQLNFIEEVVRALQECSEKKIGALIVFELDTGLKNFVETGTRINGEITTEIILSILHPRSPLHDGAIIISEKVLAAAGCILPITDDPHFAKILGLRHRAGVGLSEASDAFIIILSEEIGQVSIAKDGNLERNVSFDDLRTKLYQIFRAKEDKALLRNKQENAS